MTNTPDASIESPLPPWLRDCQDLVTSSKADCGDEKTGDLTCMFLMICLPTKNVKYCERGGKNERHLTPLYRAMCQFYTCVWIWLHICLLPFHNSASAFPSFKRDFHRSGHVLAQPMLLIWSWKRRHGLGWWISTCTNELVIHGDDVPNRPSMVLVISSMMLLSMATIAIIIGETMILVTMIYHDHDNWYLLTIISNTLLSWSVMLVGGQVCVCVCCFNQDSESSNPQNNDQRPLLSDVPTTTADAYPIPCTSYSWDCRSSQFFNYRCDVCVLVLIIA